MDSTDWSNRIRYPIFDTRSDTEFKSSPLDTSKTRCFSYKQKVVDFSRLNTLQMLRLSYHGTATLVEPS